MLVVNEPGCVCGRQGFLTRKLDSFLFLCSRVVVGRNVADLLVNVIHLQLTLG